ncbi:MAG: GatB/YqeY domain-containing protein [Gammaproteobacteria bacterium]|nr:GatB/YqeY domain-containing protein [Gammaproteobacteria bacterium]
MPDSNTKLALSDAMKTAMRAKDKPRLSVIRMALAAFKQIEVDERIDVDEERALQILDKMVKQRRESTRQYQDANRNDLANVELAEIKVLQEFLPKALSESELETLTKDAIQNSGAQSMQDMGKVMGILKPQIQGRADMGAVSKLVKSLLAGS